MGRRCVFGAAWIATAMAAVSPALAAPAGTGTSEPETRFMLSCTGAMATDGRGADQGDPGQRIVASGLIDLGSGQVSGFGVGGTPIVVVTDAVIGFGSATVDAVTRVAEPRTAKALAETGTVVEGTIDRATGATRIAVHPAADPGTILIAMTLDCAFEPAPGQAVK